MPHEKQSQDKTSSPSKSLELILLAKPHRKTRVSIRVLDGMVAIQGESGEIAVVPKEDVCKLAERFNLEIKGFKC